MMRWRLVQGFLTLVTLVGLCASPGWCQQNSASYEIAPSSSSINPQGTIQVTLGPVEVVGGDLYTWWELVYNAPGEATPRFTAQFLSDGAPLRAGVDSPENIDRYLYHETGLPAVEYIDADSGDAVLPEFQFTEYFIPKTTESEYDVNGFAPSGKYLGHSLKLQSTQQVTWTQMSVTPLMMTPHLLIGTGRTHKDDGTGKDVDGNYTIVQWTAQDYVDMIAAGHNYFLFNSVPYTDFHDQPIFYSAAVNGSQWPQQFYRSSYLGPLRYLDEPSSRAYGAMDDVTMTHPEEAGVFTEVFVEAIVNEARGKIGRDLQNAGVEVGDMVLYDSRIEDWETIFEAAYYHYAAGADGFIHESRFVLDDFNDELQNYYMVNETVTRDEMFEIYYAAMRGGARPFGASWGMAPYGQMEQASFIPSCTKAYDMGAEYIWFWTGISEHHVPYADQLAIAQAVRDHAAQHPRPPVDEVLRSAETAVIFPYGYLLGGGHPLSNRATHLTCLWGQAGMDLDTLNTSGATHRSILTAAVEAAITEMRAGRGFDFAIDSPEFDPRGYTTLIYINPDGTVTTTTP